MLCLEFQLFKNTADGIQTVIDYCATGFFKDPQVLDQELLLRLTGHIYLPDSCKFVDRKFHVCLDITY